MRGTAVKYKNVIKVLYLIKYGGIHTHTYTHTKLEFQETEKPIENKNISYHEDGTQSNWKRMIFAVS